MQECRPRPRKIFTSLRFGLTEISSLFAQQHELIRSRSSVSNWAHLFTHFFFWTPCQTDQLFTAAFTARYTSESTASACWLAGISSSIICKNLRFLRLHCCSRLIDSGGTGTLWLFGSTFLPCPEFLCGYSDCTCRTDFLLSLRKEDVPKFFPRGDTHGNSSNDRPNWIELNGILCV